MILPSVLTYSDIEAEKKLKYLFTTEDWKKTAAQEKMISIHLDIVSKSFAQNRNVLMSQPINSLWGIIKKYSFSNQKYYFSIHLMSNSDDLIEFEKYFSEIFVPDNFILKIFVYPKYVDYFNKIYAKANVEFGAWYDLDEWSVETNFQYSSNLIMTVLAGKSGQKKDPIQNQKVQEILRLNNKYFIVDGGWKTDEINMYDQNKLDIVSSGDFWSKVSF
jgi:pentose-5-phosphate-3-epimerase